jgi:hypothetical protein
MTMLVRAADIARSPGDPKVQETGPSSLGTSDSLARALGWFSIGLGAVQLLAAPRVTEALGLQGHETLVRAYGAREIATGMMCLSTNPVPGVASRIAGDALDIATLLAAQGRDNPRQGNARLALAAVIGITVLDVVCHQALTARHGRPSAPPREYRNRSGFPQGVAAARAAAARGQEQGLGHDEAASPVPPV